MNLAKTFLAIGIAIVATVFIAYGLYTLYEPPTNRYDFYGSNGQCNQKYDCYTLIDSECRSVQKASEQINFDYRSCEQQVRQREQYQACEKALQECNAKAQKQTKGYQHSRNSFFILLGISLLLIILGILLSTLQGIGSGVLGSGILLIIWNLIYTNQYWLLFPKSIKLIGLGIILIALIVMGYFKIEKRRYHP